MFPAFAISSKIKNAFSFGIGFLYNAYCVVKSMVLCSKNSFLPMCFKFRGRCCFSDLLSGPKTFFAQIRNWISDSLKNSMSLLGNYKSCFSNWYWFSFPLVIALIIFCPISAILIIPVGSIIIFAVWLAVYLIDAIWILIKAIIKC